MLPVLGARRPGRRWRLARPFLVLLFVHLRSPQWHPTPYVIHGRRAFKFARGAPSSGARITSTMMQRGYEPYSAAIATECKFHRHSPDPNPYRARMTSTIACPEA